MIVTWRSCRKGFSLGTGLLSKLGCMSIYRSTALSALSLCGRERQGSWSWCLLGNEPDELIMLLEDLEIPEKRDFCVAFFHVKHFHIRFLLFGGGLHEKEHWHTTWLVILWEANIGQEHQFLPIACCHQIVTVSPFPVGCKAHDTRHQLCIINTYWGNSWIYIYIYIIHNKLGHVSKIYFKYSCMEIGSHA